MFNKYIKQLKGDTSGVTATSDGELVIVQHMAKSNDVDEHIKVSTFQHNNWIRVNCYYEDGTEEEYYEK